MRVDKLHGSASARTCKTLLLHTELDQDFRVSWPHSHPAGSPNSPSTAIPSIALWGVGSAEPRLSFAGALLMPLGLL